MKLLVLLLKLAMVYKVSAFERHTANLRFAPEGHTVIENISEPIKISNNDYYWDRNFKPVVGRPVICEMKEDSYGWPLGEVRFENGSRVKALYYACPDTAFCGMLTCHSKDMSLLVGITLLSICAFLLCMCYVCWYRNQVHHEPREEPFEMRHMLPLPSQNQIPERDAETSMDETPFEIIRPAPIYSDFETAREDAALLS